MKDVGPVGKFKKSDLEFDIRRDGLIDRDRMNAAYEKGAAKAADADGVLVAFVKAAVDEIDRQLLELLALNRFYGEQVGEVRRTMRWAAGNVYPAGMVAIHEERAYAALRDTTTPPGSSDWHRL